MHIKSGFQCINCKVPDISLQISEELKSRMASAADENWSQVAALAFEQRLAEIFQKTANTGREAAIDRLRISRNEFLETINSEGYQAGKRWAESSASFDQLRRLGQITDRRDAESSYRSADFSGDSNLLSLTVSECLACCIEGREPDRDLARDFWRSALGLVNPPEADFSHAFVRGATEIYHAVVDRL